MSGIQMALLGTGPSATFRLDSNFYSDVGLFGAIPAEVYFNVKSDGTIEVTTFNLGLVDSYNWITPTTGSTTYFVRATPTSGSFNSGDTTGVWLALTSDRVWALQQNEFQSGFQTVDATFAIATDSGGANVVASASVTLQTEVN